MNILFVDDEILTLEYLKKILDWNSLGISTIMSATNGKEALEIINTRLPDIIITDIRMPVLDGISLIEEIRKRSATVKIIVLSAYSDFEYARKVFSNGVTGYLVKPLDEQKLLTLIKKSISEIKGTQRQEAEQTFRKTLSIENLLLEQMTRALPDEDFYEKQKKIGVYLNLSRYQLLACTFSDSSLTKETIPQTLSHMGTAITDSPIHLLRAGELLWLLLIEGETGSEEVTAIRKRLQHSIDPNTYITVSERHSGPSHLSVAYKEILHLNALHYYASDTAYVFFRRGRDDHAPQEIDINTTVHTFFTLIISRDKDAIHSYIAELQDLLVRKFGPDIHGYLDFCTVFIMLVRTKMKLYEEPLCVPKSLESFDSSVFRNYKNAQEVLSYITRVASAIIEAPVSIGSQSDNPQIKALKTYLSKHYAEKLTLESLAKEFGMSMNYLCRIFHEAAGCTLWDYLTMIRIEQAKNLLEHTRSKVSKIASNVGYGSQRYFSSVFKKKTNMTPNQYRKHVNDTKRYL